MRVDFDCRGGDGSARKKHENCSAEGEQERMREVYALQGGGHGNGVVHANVLKCRQLKAILKCRQSFVAERSERPQNERLWMIAWMPLLPAKKIGVD